MICSDIAIQASVSIDNAELWISRVKIANPFADVMSQSYFYMTVRHQLASDLANVGTQMWTGSFLLIDFLLSHPDIVKNKRVIEMGCGLGVCAVILTMLPHNGAVCTDIGSNILSLARANLEFNRHLCDSVSGNKGAQVSVDMLNWSDDQVMTNQINSNQINSNDTVILAADVIYDDDLTCDFFNCLGQLLNGPTDFLILTIEKRYNFAVDSLGVVANGYDLFLRFVNASWECYEDTASGRAPLDCAWALAQAKFKSTGKTFKGQKIPINFPQYVQDYTRSDCLELWRVSLDCDCAQNH